MANTKYIGDWRDNRKDGFGIQFYGNGDKFEVTKNLDEHYFSERFLYRSGRLEGEHAQWTRNFLGL